ncbi:hypothetical protein DCAR_0728756 [Daucus carota subsp. sativus]|uniref:Ubiquitin-like protease family profile domain-containing protein n=1 Tax=Daucus carota subsp. sativus TaxID=79200 RepID=A0AAF0XJK3_DAUCS|nr:hypothetical protein DCAR_0728756 [Daucus carota subsp. sativus]
MTLGDRLMNLWRNTVQKTNPHQQISHQSLLLMQLREKSKRLKKPTQSVYYSVIDTWATMLDDTEKYKSDKSPLRLFCTIGDLVFFPINKFQHYYLICYHLKHLSYYIIDNIKRDGDPKPYYNRVPEVLIILSKKLLVCL